jgi:DNA-binding beta-propeller fold protein YncE
MVDISRKSVLAQQIFDSKPWEVTSVSQNELAVTLPLSQTIQFLSVSSNNVKKKHTLKVDGNCHGISCHKDKMVVSFRSPAKVQILLINGTVLQTIQDNNIFLNPIYITTSDNYIYVSDSGMKTITKLNWQCEVKGKYVCKEKPLGLTMSNDGTVFVCYYDNNTIEEISGDCTKGHVVVKDLPEPETVVWSAETCTLFTSNLELREQNFIKIFKLS